MVRLVVAMVALALVAQSARADDSPTPAPTPAPATEDTGRWQRIAGLTALGVGAGALGLAGLFGLQARAQSRELDEFYRAGGMWDDTRADLERSMTANNARALSLGVVGGVVMIGGGVLYYLSTRKRAAPDRVTVVPGERGASVVWAGSF